MAYRQGIHAAKEGKKIDSNPYPEESEDHLRWLAGWVAYRERMGAITTPQ